MNVVFIGRELHFPGRLWFNTPRNTYTKTPFRLTVEGHVVTKGTFCIGIPESGKPLIPAGARLCVVAVQRDEMVFCVDALFKHCRDVVCKQVFKAADVAGVCELNGLDVLVAVIQHHRQKDQANEDVVHQQAHAPPVAVVKRMDVDEPLVQFGEERKEGVVFFLRVFAEPLPYLLRQFRHQRRCFFGGGEAEDFPGCCQDMVGLRFVFSRHDSLARLLAVRRLRHLVKRLFQANPVEISYIRFPDGPFFRGQLAGMVKGHIVGFHLLVFTQFVVSGGATVNQKQPGFVVGKRVALKAVGEVIETHAYPLPESNAVLLRQRLAGEPFAVQRWNSGHGLFLIHELISIADKIILALSRQPLELMETIFPGHLTGDFSLG